MPEGFRLMPLGLVRLRTFRLSAGSGRVTQRCHSSPDGKRGLRHTPEARAEDFGRFEKVSRAETRHRTRRVDFRGLQRPDEFAHYGHRSRWSGANGKARIERMCNSLPYVEEPLNSTVIKSFVPELRSRKCFSHFLCSMYICYEHLMYVSRSHIMAM